MEAVSRDSVWPDADCRLKKKGFWSELGSRRRNILEQI